MSGLILNIGGLHYMVLVISELEMPYALDGNVFQPEDCVLTICSLAYKAHLDACL